MDTRSSITTVTFDTNVFPADDLIERAQLLGIEVSVISVTHRELEQTSFAYNIDSLTKLPEPFVLGESRFNEGQLGPMKFFKVLERVLSILSNNSFPAQGSRTSLNNGQERILRDAMILCAHIRENRDVLVTNDCKGFIKHGRREVIEKEFDTIIMTVDEFDDRIEEIEKTNR